jgi:secreted PhoX family phosphatase
MRFTRRQFLVYLGMGSYAALRDPLRACGQSDFPLPRRKSAPPAFFTPIAASTDDRLILPDGFRYDLIRAWEDPLGSHGPLGPERFGFNNDFLAFLPIDAQNGGRNPNEGLLWVNHENPNPLFVSRYRGDQAKTAEQIQAEKLCVGGSVLHLRREQGRWQCVPDSKYVRRMTALYPKFAVTGPVADVIPEITGTLANCSGGVTPWHTVLSCEENFEEYNGDIGISLEKGYHWADVPAHQINEDHYGWIVEVDPFGELPPLKHSALGHFSHENAALRLGGSGRLVAYMGDDARDQCLYKFVSAEAYRPGATRAEQRKLLTAGTLYAADFANGKWLPLDLARSKPLQEAGFKSQAEVLLRAREAAKVLKATPLDRPEDCEVHPRDGSLYVVLSNNDRHGNFHGQIVRLVENGDDAESEGFRYELFLTGGPQSGLTCPDNLTIDKKGNLWVVCDISTRKIGRGPYVPFGNNGMYVVPTSGPSAGDAFQFASGPVDCEMAGPCFTDQEETLFLSVMHPGESSKSLEALTSHWPEGGTSMPRPAVVAITGFAR